MMTDTEIAELVNQLSFLDNLPAQRLVALSLEGADCPEAAIIRLRSIWASKERNLRKQLEKDRNTKTAAKGQKTAANIGRRPVPMPTSKAEFDRLRYEERVWLYHNERSTYEAFMARRRS